MCGRETLTVERDRERKCNVRAAIVAIYGLAIHTRHKGIGADGKIVPARRRDGGRLFVSGYSRSVAKLMGRRDHASLVCVSLCQREWNHADSEK